MNNDLVFGQGKCEEHGATWRVLNNGFSGCPTCRTEELSRNFTKDYRMKKFRLRYAMDIEAEDIEEAESKFNNIIKNLGNSPEATRVFVTEVLKLDKTDSDPMKY